MRALAHLNRPPAPDYTLRVPANLQLLIVLGLLAGLAGVGVLVGAANVSPVIGFALFGPGVIAAILAAALWTITSPRLRERARRRMLDAVAWHGDEQVLDVGCGNGFLLVEVAKRLTTGSATGIELWKSEAGAQRADAVWSNAQLEGVADRVDIRNIDARVMPFAARSFDVILSSLMLHHAGSSADREQVVREMVRVLKPEGTILLYDARPLISGAARLLRSLGFTQTDLSGGLMTVIAARRS